MRTLLITLAIFVSSFIQAQDRYDLFIRHGKGIRFTEENDLSRLNQITGKSIVPECCDLPIRKC